jgi:predicted nucleic acid-binding protein
LNRCVVDASVALKWYVPEIHAGAALRLLESQQTGDLAIHVPDLFLAEAGNVLWKKVRRKELSERQAEGIARAVLSVPNAVHPTELLLPTALSLACSLDTTLYDSLYLALAALLDCPLITADRRFYSALRGSQWAQLVHWVEET